MSLNYPIERLSLTEFEDMKEVMRWVSGYELWLDGNPTGIELEGCSKKSAFETQAEDQWRLYFPLKTFPKRSRMKLVLIESYRD